MNTIWDVCGEKGVRVQHVTRSYGKNSTLLVVENVPIIACPNCGESYLTAETLHEIASIRLHRNAMAKKRTVSVAAFA